MQQFSKNFSNRGFARLIGISEGTVRRGKKEGLVIPEADGRIDPNRKENRSWSQSVLCHPLAGSRKLGSRDSKPVKKTSEYVEQLCSERRSKEAGRWFFGSMSSADLEAFERVVESADCADPMADWLDQKFPDVMGRVPGQSFIPFWLGFTEALDCDDHN